MQVQVKLWFTERLRIKTVCLCLAFFQGCGITRLYLAVRLWQAAKFAEIWKYNADCGESKEITPLGLSLRLWLLEEALFLTVASVFSLQECVRSPFCWTCLVWRSVNGEGHFESRKTQESAIQPGRGGVCNFKYIPIQVTAQMAGSDNLNTNGNIHIYIHLTKLLI